MDEEKLTTYFSLFNEIAIINQLSTASLDALLPEGIINSHFGVLNHLIRVGDGATPLALANAFQVPKTTMTHTLLGLDKHQLVEMKPNPADGRSKQVWITPKGRDLRNQTISATAPLIAEALGGLSFETVQALTNNLAKIRKTMDVMRDEK